MVKLGRNSNKFNNFYLINYIITLENSVFDPNITQLWMLKRIGWVSLLG